MMKFIVVAGLLLAACDMDAAELSVSGSNSWIGVNLESDHTAYPFEAGIHYYALPSLSHSAGYRALSTDANVGQQDRRFIGGAFIGTAWRF